MLNAALTKTQVIGYNRVSILNRSRAKIVIKCLNAVNSQVNNDSLCGLFQDFLIVGPKPETSDATSSIIDQAGCFTMSHRPSAMNEVAKKMISNLVIFFSPYFKDKKKIKIQIKATASVIQAPTPAPPYTCSAQVIELAIDQIKNVKVCGTVLLARISRT